jgi:hypothetical protein
MRHKVPWNAHEVNAVALPCSGLDEYAAVLDPRRVDGGAESGLVDALPRSEVELPPVPGAAEHMTAGHRIAPGCAGNALFHRPEAERAAMMRATIADSVQVAGSRVANDPDLTTANSRDHSAVSLEVGHGADIDPVAHATTRPSLSP